MPTCRMAIFIGWSLAASGLSGCGEASPGGPGTVQSATGGSVPAPVLVAADRGILQDQSTYQPANYDQVPRTGSARAGGESGGTGNAAPIPGAADVQRDAQRMAQDLVHLLRDGEFNTVLRLFPGEQVAALVEASDSPTYDAMFATFEKFEVLRGMAVQKFGPSSGEALNRVFTNPAAADSRVTVLDTENASITPNVTQVMFGPDIAGGALALTFRDGRWRAQLAAPLDDASLGRMLEFQKAVQSALDRIIEALEGGRLKTEEAVVGAVQTAIRGEAVELP